MAISYENASNTLNHNVIDIKSEFFIDALHLFVLFSFGIAQPLFDLLSRYPEFFVARKSEPIDIILLVCVMCFVFPAIGVLFELLASVFGRRFRKAVHWFIVATLSAVIALQVLNKIFEFHGILLIMMASVLGVVATIVYVRLRPARIFLTVLCPVILIFPGLFLFNSSVYKVVFPEKEPSAFQIKIDDPPPIIMVVFDEFPVTSLMDEDGKIDPIRYPNFAALAEDAYWFRNAMTVAAETMKAIPALLTGNYPEASCQAVASDYPNNIFSLLGGYYDIKDFEIYTQLCPAELSSGDTTSSDLTQRISLLFSDLLVVYLHVVLPAGLTGRLPSIGEGWVDFIDNLNNPIENNRNGTSKNTTLSKPSPKKLYNDRPGQFLRFVNSIKHSREPTLYFLHFLLPHRPWEYLPSGKKYNRLNNSGLVPGPLKGVMWIDDEWVVVQAYQKHLLQVGFLDTLLGKLIKKLKETQLYNECLFVVTADHGFSFRVKDYARVVTKLNSGDVAGIPLFVKAPNQEKGVIIDKAIESIDLLPTIADILDIELPWASDGHSAFDNRSVERIRDVSFLNPGGNILKLETKSLQKVKRETLKRKLGLFGSGSDPGAMYKIGPFKNLLGEPLKALNIAEGNVRIELDQAAFYSDVSPRAAFVPVRISGLAFLEGRTGTQLDLAISVNRVIRATTRSSRVENDSAEWSAMVREMVFRGGKNEIEIFVISHEGTQIRLERTERPEKNGYSLLAANEKPFKITIISSAGQTIPVRPGEVKGHLALPEVGEAHVTLQGWAADLKASRPADAVIVFLDGNSIYSGYCNAPRPDVARKHHNPSLKNSGFKYFLPLSFFRDLADIEVRIFAISKRGVASEVYYPKGYRWCKKPAQVSVFKDRHGRLKPKQTKEREGVSFVPYELISDKTIASADGKAIKVIPNAMKGYLGVAKIRGKQVVFSGWAADVKYSRLPESILAFLDEKLVYSGKTDRERPDVAQHFKNSSLKMTGFKFMVPTHFFTGEVNPELRIFAVSKEGVATELKYPKNYKWGKK